MGFLGGIGKAMLGGLSGVAKGIAGGATKPKLTSHDPGGTWGQSSGIPGFLKRKPKGPSLVSRSMSKR